MHQSSKDLFKKHLDVHLPDKETSISVLDAGGYHLTYEEEMKDHNVSVYDCLDCREGGRANIVVKNPLDWDIANQYDVVISGQTVEHVHDMFSFVRNMERACKPGGLIIIVAPWLWHMHFCMGVDDCWRILPHGMRYLFTDVCQETDFIEYGFNGTMQSQEGDCIGLGRKQISTKKSFLITRFNIGTYSNGSKIPYLWEDKTPATIQDIEQWMKLRVDIFTKYCLPNIERQTLDEFEWILLFDEATPDKWMNIIIKSLDKTKLKYTILTTASEYADECTNELYGVQDYIKSKTNKGDTVYTTNMDNDSFISTNYLKEVRSYEIEDAPICIDAIQRTHFHMDEDLKVRFIGSADVSRESTSSTSSLVEKYTETLATVIRQRHENMINFYKVVLSGDIHSGSMQHSGNILARTYDMPDPENNKIHSSALQAYNKMYNINLEPPE